MVNLKKKLNKFSDLFILRQILKYNRIKIICNEKYINYIDI